MDDVNLDLADAIEAAMREPVAYQDTWDTGLFSLPGDVREADRSGMVPLFRLPPDAQAEIERLKALWYAETDPEKTEYAEDFYLRAGGKSTREPSIEIERLKEQLRLANIDAANEAAESERLLSEIEALVRQADSDPFMTVGHFVEHVSGARATLDRKEPNHE